MKKDLYEETTNSFGVDHTFNRYTRLLHLTLLACFVLYLYAHEDTEDAHHTGMTPTSQRSLNFQIGTVCVLSLKELNLIPFISNGFRKRMTLNTLILCMYKRKVLILLKYKNS